MTDAPRRPHLPPTGRSLPIALLRAREVVMVPVRAALADSGVNEQKWRVMRVLDERGPMEQTAIAEGACLQLPSLTRMLRAMEDEGLVTRATDPTDRRKAIVTLTDAGRAILIAHADAANAIFDRLRDRYGAEKLTLLLDLLEDLRQTRLQGD